MASGVFQRGVRVENGECENNSDSEFRPYDDNVEPLASDEEIAEYKTATGS